MQLKALLMTYKEERVAQVYGGKRGKGRRECSRQRE
jgi:hypothetical protein